MNNEQYRAIEEWLSEYISYLPNLEMGLEVQKCIELIGIHLSDILYVLQTGQVVWADRDREFGHFIVKGRNCDERKISVYGRFDSATMWVVIDEIHSAE